MASGCAFFLAGVVLRCGDDVVRSGCGGGAAGLLMGSRGLMAITLLAVLVGVVLLLFFVVVLLLLLPSERVDDDVGDDCCCCCCCCCCCFGLGFFLLYSEAAGLGVFVVVISSLLWNACVGSS